MSIPSLIGANVALGTDTFGGWFNLTNQITYAVSEKVVTVANVAAANSTNSAQTTGNGHVEGIFSANTLVAATALRGGTIDTPAALPITSNAVFSGALVSSSANVTISGTLTASGNVAISGGTKTLTISTANTNISAGTLTVSGNSVFSGTTVGITAPTLTITSNTSLTAANVVINADRLSIGSNSSDALSVYSTTDMQAPLTVNAAAAVGSLTVSNVATLNGNVVIGSNTSDTVTVSGVVASNVIPSASATHNIGSASSYWATGYFANTVVSGDAETSGDIIARGGSARTIKAQSTDTSYQDLAFTLRTSTGNTKTPINLTSTAVLPGANATFTLGSAAMSWTSIFGTNLTVTANVAAVNVIASANVSAAQLHASSLTSGRVAYVGASGRLVDDADLTFNGSTLTANNIAVTTDLTVSGDTTLNTMTATGNTVIEGDLTVLGTTSLSSNVDLTVNGSIATTMTVNSVLTSNGNTVIGNAAADRLTVNALLSSNLSPTANSSYSLGATDKRWTNVYASNLYGSLAWSNLTGVPSPKITVSLSGDVTGTANATLSSLANGTISITTSIAADSVALGTDTTGNYVASVSAGGGISVSGTGEGAAVTVSHADTSAVANLASDNSGGTVLQDITANFDTYGHVSSLAVVTVDLDGRYATNTIKTVTTDSGSVVASGKDDTINIVGGSGITTSGATDVITVTSTDTLQTVTDRGAVTNNDIQVADITAVDGTFTGNMVVGGNLTVSGTMTTVNTETINLADNIIVLNSNETGIPSQDGGIEIERGTSANKSLLWKESTTRWSVGSDSFEAASFIGSLAGNANTATQLATARTISLTGDVTGSVSFNGTANVSITAVVADDSHNHIIGNVDGLQTALNAKLDSSTYTASDVLTKLLTVDGALSTLDADLLDGQHGSYYSDYNNLTNKPTTTGITEGTNLYYTVARANSAIDSRVTKTMVDALGINAATVGGLANTSLARVDAVSTFTANTIWQDDKRIQVGTGVDMQLYSSASNIYMDLSTGHDLYIRNSSDSSKRALFDRSSGKLTATELQSDADITVGDTLNVSANGIVFSDATTLTSAPLGPVPHILVNGLTTGVGLLTGSGWHNAPIDSLDINSLSVSHSSPNIQLAAGTYYVEWTIPGSFSGGGTGSFSTQLNNSTANSTLVTGQSNITIGENYTSTQLVGMGQFTLASSANVAFQIKETAYSDRSLYNKGLLAKIWKTA